MHKLSFLLCVCEAAKASQRQYLTEMADAQTHKQGKKEPENTEKKDNKQ